MDLRYLQTFREIVKEGSFTKAAKKLAYTQSTITFHVDSLEKELGVALFEKVGRRMVLTKAGEEFVPYVEEVLASVEKLKNFQSDLAEMKGTLKIAAPESILCYRLPPLFREFHDKAPMVHLFLKSMNSRNVQNALKEDETDIGIFYNPKHEVDSQVEWKHFEDYPLILFGSPNIKRKYPDFITPHQRFPKLAAIGQPMPGSLRQYFQSYLESKDIVPGNTIEIRSTQTIKNLVKCDIGICYLPRFVVAEEIKRGELTELPTDMDRKPIESVYGYRKGRWLSPAMKLFLDILEEQKQP